MSGEEPETSLVSLAAAIAARRLSAGEVVEIYLDRIAQRNGELNAVVTVAAEQARAEARLADEKVTSGERLGSLHGVPFTVKDVFATAGLRTTAGFPLLGEYVPAEDATVVARLRAAGAIVIGKTNTAMLALGPRTDNPLFGQTLHPTHPDRSVGGSSGGSACAVASGMSPLDVASDSTGSIRIPASFVGVCGFKPTRRRVSMAGHIPPIPTTLRLDRWLTTPGLIAASPGDLAAAFRVVTGPDPRDPETFAGARADDSAPAIAIPGLRVAWARAMPGEPVAASISAAVERWVTDLDRRGARVEEAMPPLTTAEQEDVLLGFLRLFNHGAQEIFGFSPTPVDGPPPSAVAILTLLSRCDEVATAWETFFRRFDVFICPTTPCTAPLAADDASEISIDGRQYPFWKIDRHTFQASIAGLPALTVPRGADAAGLPIGAQLIAAHGKDEALIAIAGALTAET